MKQHKRWSCACHCIVSNGWLWYDRTYDKTLTQLLSLKTKYVTRTDRASFDLVQADPRLKIFFRSSSAQPDPFRVKHFCWIRPLNHLWLKILSSWQECVSRRKSGEEVVHWINDSCAHSSLESVVDKNFIKRMCTFL